MNALTMTNTNTNTATGLTVQGFNAAQFEHEWDAWIRDRAESTQAGYNVTVKSFIEWIYQNGITQPTRDDIINYKIWLENPHTSRKTGKEIKFSTDTAIRYFRGVKMFFSFLENQGLYKDVTKNVRPPQTKQKGFRRDHLDRDGCLKILASIKTDNEAGKRDYALILACISCGFRIIEMQRANIGDIETHNGERRLYIQGKGDTGKNDYKKVEPELWQAIDDYLTARGTRDKDAPLFAAVKSNAKPGGGRLTEPSVSRIIKNRLKKAGFDSKRITAHSLRHTSVTLDKDAGATLEEAQLHARHSSPVTTQKYDHSKNKEKATDERRIMDYLFSNETKDEAAQAAEIISRLDAEKRKTALDFLKALAKL